MKHATAKDVATLLTNLVSGQSQAASKADQQAGRSGQPGVPRPQTPPPGTTPNLANLVGEGGTSTQFSNLVTILADDRSNAVVVSGTVDDIRLIREIVGKVDVLLAQVSIQVVIAEVTLNDTDTSGINALNLTVATNNVAGTPYQGTHITNFNTVGANDTSNYGVAGWTITGGVVNPMAFQAALSNNGTKSNVKVLSANTVVTTHNKQAEFVVSQQLPIVSGSQTAVSGGLTTGVAANTYTYKDIGIDVKVTPLIGEDGSVQLEVDQKVDDVVSTLKLASGDVQPIIGHREATSFVNVADGQMIVLGGLQQSKHSTSRTKLGFFFEIPIISQLFGGRTHEEDRTELLLFVRPQIIPPGESTKNADASIDQLNSKDQVKQFLSNPAKDKKDSLLKQLTQ